MVDTLGPFAAVLNQITTGINFDQQVCSEFLTPKNELTVWRAALLTEEQVESYFLTVHKRQKIQL